jgi:hypothetical protein
MLPFFKAVLPTGRLFDRKITQKGLIKKVCGGRRNLRPNYMAEFICKGSVPNPDPHVFEPPGSESGSISQRYGSGSFHQQAKIVRKTLIPTVL